MKKIKYILIGLLIYPVLADLSELSDSKLNTKLWIKVGFPSYGLTLGLSGRCTDRTNSRNIKQRDYFGCGKLNILISDLLYKE